MLAEYPRFVRGEVEKEYLKLPQEERKIIEDYIFWRRARGTGVEKSKDLRRYIIHIRIIINTNFNQFKELEDHTKLVLLIKKSYLSNNVKKNILIDLNNFFGEYLFEGEWKNKFKSLYYNDGTKDMGKEDNENNRRKTPTNEEVELMVKTETRTFWKTLLLDIIKSRNRQIESRTRLNEKIKFNDDGTSTYEIFMTKNKRTKYNLLDVQTTDYIKKLQQEQKNNGTYGKYLYHSPSNINKPISRPALNKWFSELSIKATGKHYTPHCLRHKGATELYNLAKNNKISEYTVLKLIGHSRSMMSTYDHTPNEEEIKILKQQIENIEISPEKKHELELQLEEQNKKIEDMQKDIKFFHNFIKNQMQEDDATHLITMGNEHEKKIGSKKTWEYRIIKGK